MDISIYQRYNCYKSYFNHTIVIIECTDESDIATTWARIENKSSMTLKNRALNCFKSIFSMITTIEIEV